MRLSHFLSLLRALGLLCVLVLPAAAQDTNFPSGPQYLMTNSSPLFARQISTPSLSFPTELEQPTDHTGSETLQQEYVQDQLNELPPLNYYLLDYAPPILGVAEVGSPNSANQETQELPPNFFDTGIGQMLTPQQMRQMGYGLTLAQAAAQAREHKTAPTHVYTNEDIERLQQQADARTGEDLNRSGH